MDVTASAVMKKRFWTGSLSPELKEADPIRIHELQRSRTQQIRPTKLKQHEVDALLLS